MVRQRRLVASRNELVESALKMARSMGVTSLGPVADEDWEEFEDLYFQLKEEIGFERNPEDVANSLSDLTSAIWFGGRNSEEVAFVTMNKTILKHRKELKAKYHVLVVTPEELMEVVRKKSGKEEL